MTLCWFVPVRVLIPLFFYYLEKCMTTYCSDCDNKIDAQDIKYPVGDGYICDDCFSPDEYDKCVYCGDHTYYKYSQLNSSFECPEHAGESIMDDEDAEGWEDNIRKFNEE